MNNTTEFLTELHELLKKYNASISWSCDPCSDTHGIYDEVITIDINGKEVMRTEEGRSWLDAESFKDK